MTQAALADALGVAVVTISKAEQLDRIGSLNERLMPLLLTDDEVCLELGLMPVAIARAEKKGLPVWKEPIGKFYWSPLVRRWAAATRTRFPSSVDSQARDLCQVLGLSMKAGLLPCDVCDEEGLAVPNVAFRRCKWCLRAVCGSSRCADYVQLPNHDLRLPMPVACVRCTAAALRDAAVFLGLNGNVLPNVGSVGDELERQYADIRARSKGRMPDTLAMYERVKNTMTFFSAIRDGLVAQLKFASSPPEGLPDVFANARLGLAHTEEELEKLKRLSTRIEKDRMRA
jgi:hypothetical protein